ncbi:MAG: hypothetical protein RIF46_00315 [Cyclobacteriaceae bacterium]
MLYRILFLIGLAFEVFGQVLLAQGNDFVYALRPIDFAHWSLLVGVVLMMPQVVSFPKKIYSLIGTPTAIIGIVCIIGMCVLDFIWWSMPDQQTRNEFATHLSQVPSIWTPFITDGPRFLTIGLSILSLNYFREHKLGVAIVIISTLILIHVIPFPFRLISGYSLTMIGFGVIFFKEKFH